ncbi:MAG: Allophanate hydrolase 2 subunit 1 (EC 3.5.1.54) [Olavius algarvensis Delta 4 endosymbiont]|nr:MAG: Allophanate hydrolase 2 subunit 1 (EC 3.5.1.54) [Olavius algarvensis Delta 4 endosymbiont]
MSTNLYAHARFRLAGDSGLLVEYGDGIDPEVNARVRAMDMVLASHPLKGVREVTPTYRSLLILYDPLQTDPDHLSQELVGLENRLGEITIPPPDTVEIPVCYGGDHGPDIEHVAQTNGLAVEDVIRLHSETVYSIYMIGFTPGFCFLGGLPDALHTPRLETPRMRVPEGSVGIANAQTGIYPLTSPGGWQLIGRTPLRLFAPEKGNPFIYKTGDSIRFVPIPPERYAEQIRKQEGP